MTTTNIYLVHTRECRKSNKNIYKIGRSSQEDLKRFKSYPKGSELLFNITCKYGKIAETDLLRAFRNKYVQEQDYGREYFRGNKDEMIKDIFEYITERNKMLLEKKNAKKKIIGTVSAELADDKSEDEQLAEDAGAKPASSEQKAEKLTPFDELEAWQKANQKTPEVAPNTERRYGINGCLSEKEFMELIEAAGVEKMLPGILPKKEVSPVEVNVKPTDGFDGYLNKLREENKKLWGPSKPTDPKTTPFLPGIPGLPSLSGLPGLPSLFPQKNK